MPQTIASTVSSVLGKLESDSSSSTSTGTAGTITVAGPTSLTGTAGLVLGLGALSITDTGATSPSTVTVTVTDSTGKLGLYRGLWLQDARFSSDDHTLTLTGSLQQVDQGLGALAYLASASGTDTVAVSATDSAGNVGTGTLAVAVQAATPAAGVAGTITVSIPATLSAQSGSPLAISGLSVADTGAGTSTTVTATITDTLGQLGLRRGPWTDDASLSSNGHTLTLTGGLDQVNQGLGALAYEASTSGTDAISVSIADSVGNLGIGTSSVAVSSAGTTSTAGTTGTASGSIVLDSTQTTYTATTGISTVLAEGDVASVVGGAQGSTVVLYARSGTVDYQNAGGAGIVVDQGSTALTLEGGSAGSSLLAFARDASTSYTGGAGSDEIIAGSGSLTAQGGTAGSLLLFGGSGTLQFTGGAESDTIVGGSGAETIQAGTAGGGVFAGTGGSVLVATGSNTFLAGAVTGDQLTAASSGGDILIAGAGNETLNGLASAAANLLFAGRGADVVQLGGGADTFVGGAGADTVQAGAGDAQIYVGGGAELIEFTAGTISGGSDVISGFRVGTDHLKLTGYSASPTLTVASGNSVLALSDGTKVTLVGVTAANTTSILS